MREVCKVTQYYCVVVYLILDIVKGLFDARRLGHIYDCYVLLIYHSLKQYELSFFYPSV